MNEFVGTVPFLRIAFNLGFDMKTINFHIAETGLFYDSLTPMKKLVWDAR